MKIPGWKAEKLDDYEIRITAADGEAWRIRWADKHDGLNHFIWKMALAAVSIPEKWGCHCDLEPGMKPDGCVLDEGKPENCVYARMLLADGKSRDDCKEWRKIEVVEE